MSLEPRGLVAPSDIAEMADVTRAAVSNWRKRADDFPEPVAGTASKPLFDRAEVTRWLIAAEKKIVHDRGELTLWAVLNEFRGLWSVDEMADVVLTLACARRLSEEATSDVPPWQRLLSSPPGSEWDTLAGAVNEEAARDPRWEALGLPERALEKASTPALLPLFVALDHVEVGDLAEVADHVLARVAAAEMRLAGEHGLVGSKVSVLLGKLAARHTHAGPAVVYDPACGLGSALIEAARGARESGQLIGHDINRRAIRQAAQRAFLHGLTLETKLGDVLAADPDPSLRADAVVLEPPFGLRWDSVELADRRWQFGMPPKSSADFAWIQHAVTHLDREGRAYVVTPMGALFRGGAERGIRRELLLRGCVETIVALPRKLLPHTSVALALWVLRSPAAPRASDGVRFFDGTEVADVEDTVPDWCDVDWVSDPAEVPHRVVEVSEVLSSDSDLTPQRWTTAAPEEPTEIASLYYKGWQDMKRALTKAEGTSGLLNVFSGAANARVWTVGELVEQGVLEARAGKKHKGLSPGLEARMLTAGDVRDGVLKRHSDLPADLEEKHPELTRAGDVLVTTMNQVRTLIDEFGGHLPAPGVYRLRVNDPGQLSPEFLALVLRGSWNHRFQAGSTIRHATLKNLEVPVVSAENQRGFRVSISALQQLQDAAEELRAHAATVERSLLDALRYNVELDEPPTP